MSVPCAMAPMPDAAAAEAPPEEPPGVMARPQGLRVWPCRVLRVDQRREKAGVLVRPMMTAPALRRLATTGLSISALRSRWILRPLLVTWPDWSTFTLMVMGTPPSGPASSPRARRASIARAAASASSGISVTTALIAGLTAVSRASALSVASRAETLRDLMRLASSLADNCQSSAILDLRRRYRIFRVAQTSMTAAIASSAKAGKCPARDGRAAAFAVAQVVINQRGPAPL